MNILVVVGYNPFIVRDGNAIRVSSMLRELVIQGHKVSLLIYTLPWAKNKKLVHFYGIKQYLFTVRPELLLFGFLLRQFFRVPVFSLTCSLIPPFYGFKKIIKKIIENDRINIVQCENIYTVPQIIKCGLSIPVVVSALDVLYDRYKQALELEKVLISLRKIFLKWLQQIEIDSIKRSSVCVCVSEEDRKRFIEMSMGISEKKLIVIPMYHPAAALRAGAVDEQLRQNFLKIPAEIERVQKILDGVFDIKEEPIEEKKEEQLTLV